MIVRHTIIRKDTTIICKETESFINEDRIKSNVH
jgi:hypothetical protein